MKYRVVTCDYDDSLLFHQYDLVRHDIVDWYVNKELVRRLKAMIAEGTTVYIVTARGEGLDDDTPYQTPPYRFVKEHGLNVSGIFYTNGQFKVDTLKRLGSQLHFDDNEEELMMLQAHAPEIQRVMIVRPESVEQTMFEPNRITKKGAKKIRGLISDIDRVILSDKPITEIRTIPQKPGRKPKGLWYGLSDEWLSYVEDGMPSWMKGYNYVYTIQPSPSVLYISELDPSFGKIPKELLEFTKKYGADYDAFSDHKCPGIDWRAVSKDYDGIEIIPYIMGSGEWPSGDEECVFWYYGWDIASGCIWNPRGLSSIELVLDLSRKR